MNSRKLHELVTSLSLRQQKAFSRFINSGSTKKSKVKILFERLRKYETFDSEIEKKVRGKEFANSDQYYQFRERLLDKLVSCFALSKESKGNPFVYIQTAASFSALSLAQKVWLSECQKANEKEDFLKLLSLYDLRGKLEQQYNFQLSTETALPPREQVLNCYLNENSIREVVNQLREARKRDHKSKKLLVSSLSSFLSNFSPATQQAQFSLLKARFLKELILGNLDKAWGEQRGLVKFLEGHDSFSLLETIKEFHIFSILSLNLNRVEESTEYMFRIGKASPKTFGEENQILAYWIPGTLSVAEHFGRLDLLAGVTDQLATRKDMFSEGQLCLMYFQIALTFLYNEKFSEAVRWINQILSFPTSSRGVFTWQPSVFLLLLHFELRNVDLLESLVGSAKRACKGAGIEYPFAVIKTVEELANVVLTKEEATCILEAKLSLFSNLVTNPDEARAESFIDFRLWLKSKLHRSPMVELLENASAQSGNDEEFRVSV